MKAILIALLALTFSGCMVTGGADWNQETGLTARAGFGYQFGKPKGFSKDSNHKQVIKAGAKMVSR